ncbi:MAG TPA: cation-transporting P-type ATPase [Drouetiella sp.]|jgi:P-type Ca2+ transporter type 2C
MTLANLDKLPQSDELSDRSLLPVETAGTQEATSVVQKLKSDVSKGLTTADVQKRLALVNAQHHLQSKAPNAFKLFIDQYRSTVVVVLLIATGASVVAREYTQAAGIAIAVVINSIVGFLTEYRSQISLAELEKLSGPLARVRRDGVDKNVAVTDLVPGDIILLIEGDRVPADARLVSSSNLSVDESALTGESVPVFKSCEGIDNEPNSSVLLQGSIVAAGKTKAIVVATGTDTMLGKLGRTLTELTSRSTPLQDELEQLGRQLSLVIVIICAVLFGIGLMKGENSWQMLQTSIALAIAAIPEGLPVIATLTLAEGTRKMAKLGALTRRLSAVETLGCTEIICTDKTGTLTTNELMVSAIIAGKNFYSVSGSGHMPDGSFFDQVGNEVDWQVSPQLHQLLLVAALCNDAKLESHDECDWHIHGDPTEGALLTVSMKAGIEKATAEKSSPRVKEFAFDLQRKRMTTLHAQGSSLSAYSKGAPESVLDTCTYFETQTGVSPLDNQTKLWIREQNELLARRGLRVLAFARKQMTLPNLTAASQPDATFTELNKLDQQSVESKMIFLGLIGMSDKAKVGIEKSIAECTNAGIKIIMVTGDHPTTACAIAKEIGIVNPDTEIKDVVSSGDVDNANWHDDADRLNKISVLARVQPEGKFRIIRALQSAGKIVAMTGDGVNDAAALKQADIGIAMGQGGASLAREASDMVLTDDNFGVLVSAIEQGRTIYANIRCSIAYLLTASLASVFFVAGASAANMPLPMSPIQLLWLNLIMHIFPGLGLALQKSYEGIMLEKPRGRNQKLLDAAVWRQIIIRGLCVAMVSLLTIGMNHGSTAVQLQTIALASMSLSLLMQSWSWLAIKRVFDIRFYVFNAPMQICTALGLAMLLAGTSLRPVQEILNTTTLSPSAWLLVVASSLGALVLTAFFKKLFDSRN